MGEDYAKAVQTYKDLFPQYGYQQLADSLPEVSQEHIANETGEMNVTASDSSQPRVLDSKQPCSSQVQVTTSVGMTEASQPDDSIISDDFFYVRCINYADIAAELNDILTIEQQSPYSSMVPGTCVNYNRIKQYLSLNQVLDQVQFQF